MSKNFKKWHDKKEKVFAFPFDAKIISVAVVSQVRLLDVRRLSRKIGEMRENDFKQLINKIKALLP